MFLRVKTDTIEWSSELYTACSSPFLLKSDLSQPAILQTTTLCYNKGLLRDEKYHLSQFVCLGFAFNNFAKKDERLLAV